MSSISHQVYRRLFHALGPQGWWPGESWFEILVGTVLVQNTNWQNVEKAIARLREAGLLTPDDFLGASTSEIEERIRPSGYFRQKTKRLFGLVDFLDREYGGSVEAMAAADLRLLRSQLLSLHGIGPETADSILLYALDRPAMVVDTYTHRIFSRHGWVDAGADYSGLQSRLVEGLPLEARIYNEMHALLVNVGHHHCRKTPRCETCPLQEMLPETGIVASGGR